MSPHDMTRRSTPMRRTSLSLAASALVTALLSTGASAGSEPPADSAAHAPTAEQSDWIAAGIIDGVIQLNRRAGQSLLQARAEDGFEREMHHWQRSFSSGRGSSALHSSFFLKGKIRGDVLLTAAYDSDKVTRERVSAWVRPEAFYPVYGDAALRGSEAPSASKLYVRIDKDRSFLLWGDFSTADDEPKQPADAAAGLRLRDLGAYQRRLTGLKLHSEGAAHGLNVHATRDSTKQVTEEFPALGVSGPYALANTGALLGSERVEIVVRDRNQRSRILSSTPLAALEDYSWEPFSGRLLLRQPVSSLDERLNPVFIRVTYELEQAGESFWIWGADGQMQVSDTLQIGGSVAKDANPLSGYALRSAHAGLRLGPRSTAVAEFAVSRTQLNTGLYDPLDTPALAGRTGEVQGRAFRLEVRHEGDGWEARAYAGVSEPEFHNPQASLQGGRAEAGIVSRMRLDGSTQLVAQGLRSEDRYTGGGRRAADVAVVHQLTPQWQVEAGLRAVREEGHSSATPPWPFGSISAGGPGGGGFRGIGDSNFTSPWGANPVRNGGFSEGPGAAPVDAETARIGLRYTQHDRWSLAAEVEHGLGSSRAHRLALGADYRLTDRTRLYGRFENQNALASVFSANPADRSRAIAAGVSSSFLTGGEVYTEYRLRDALDSRTAARSDLQLASGVQNVFEAAPGLRWRAGAEHLRVLSGGGREGFALTGALEWTAHAHWKASGRLEYRRIGDDAATAVRDTQDSWLSTVSIARSINAEWTALVRNYALYSNERALPGHALQNRFQLGAAYRPAAHNRTDAFMKLEHRFEYDGERVAGADKSRATIASLHVNHHPARDYVLAGRLAAKRTHDRYGGYTAYLAGGRVTWDLAPRWDASLLASARWSPEGRTRQWAQGAEVGYALHRNLWLSAGMNWTGFSDRDLTGGEYTNRGVYLRLRFKFDERSLPL